MWRDQSIQRALQTKGFRRERGNGETTHFAIQRKREQIFLNSRKLIFNLIEKSRYDAII